MKQTRNLWNTPNPQLERFDGQKGRKAGETKTLETNRYSTVQ